MESAAITAKPSSFPAIAKTCRPLLAGGGINSKPREGHAARKVNGFLTASNGYSNG